jgi:hypothetical protein
LYCKSGVLELLAQTVKMSWKESSDLTSNAHSGELVHRTETIIIPPLLMDNTKASTEWAAVDGAVPSLNLDHLKKMTEFVRFVLIMLLGDNSSSNARVRAYVHHAVAMHNSAKERYGKLMMLEQICMGHIITRAVIITFGYVSLIPKCYALYFVLRFLFLLNKKQQTQYDNK